jgi:Domain of unknown function (DUF4132)
MVSIVDKGAFKGKSLSSIKPKEASGDPVLGANLELPIEAFLDPVIEVTPASKLDKKKPDPNADLTIDIEGTPAEIAAARLEKVISLVLTNSSLDDGKKEGIIYDVLNRKPKEVKFEVLQQLPAIIKRLEPAKASAARMFNVWGKLLAEQSLLNPWSSANHLIDYTLRNISEALFRDGPEYVANALDSSEPEVSAQVIELLPAKIAALKVQLQQPGLLPVSERLIKHQVSGFEAALKELKQQQSKFLDVQANLSSNDGPTAKAQGFIRIILAKATTLQTYDDLRRIGQRGMSKMTPEEIQALFPAMFDSFVASREHALNHTTPNFNLYWALDQMFLKRLEMDIPFSQLEQELLLQHLEREVLFYSNGSNMRLVNLIKSQPEPKGLHVALMRRIAMYFAGSAKEFKPFLNQDVFPVSPGEFWSDAFLNHLEQVSPAERASWIKLCKHALSSEKAKPNEAWEKIALEITAQIPGFSARLLEWFTLVGKPRTFLLYRDNDHFDHFNNNVMRGLIWAIALQPATDAIARGCANVIELSLKKLPGTGPRAVKLANAGVFALGRMDSLAAVGQMARLKARVTFKTTLKEIEKALDATAARQGVSKADLEELSVPSYGLERVGKADFEFGKDDSISARAELRVVNSSVRISWFDANGKALKNPPSSLKTDFADDLKELKGSVKDIEQMLSAQSVRLERLLLSRKSWSFQDWLDRYAEHPLIACVTRRLIWNFSSSEQTQAGMWSEDGFKDATGNALKIADDAQVSLWHPITSSTPETLAWRAFLEARGIMQPWKQAHREIYVLTDAEIRTNVYSNRFASHVIKQHQFSQLAAIRGWKNQLRLMVDDSYEPAKLELPQWGLRAEYWVEGAGSEYGVDTNETGTYNYLSTDQVRFYHDLANANLAHAGGGGYEQWVRNGANPSDPIPLEQIPALVLSEVLRDVDLFVGVCSVGNDPTWNDGGPQGRYREYWESYSFGELTESSQSRKALLEMLIPRLKIRDRARIDGKFLRVLGHLREYKIHLGSGNILMEPNDQYLCIVPGQGIKSLNDPTGDISLPFEGDRTLAVILSKAFLLADDISITDPTITRQIKR